ncbi:SHOCT domain-containing protein [Enterococcus faecalis]
MGRRRKNIRCQQTVYRGNIYSFQEWINDTGRIRKFEERWIKIMGLFKHKKKDDIEFTETSSYGPIKIDETRKLFKYKSEIFNYTDLISFELIEDGNQVTHGGISLGRAALGGILFGTSGAAITGASKIKKEDKNYCSQLDIMIRVKNSPKPTKFIKLITFKIDKSKFMYKQMANTAKEILGGLNYILDNIETQPSSDNAIDQFDNLKKLKELLDMGILSQEEFDKKKQKLLDL